MNPNKLNLKGIELYVAKLCLNQILMSGLEK